MKFCADHWEKLRKAIDARGLWPFVACEDKEAMRRLADAEIEKARRNFDPLMGAHNSIVGRALDAIGPALFAPNDDGSHRCPLCFLDIQHKANCQDPKCIFSHEHWIDYAADDAIDEAKRLGLVGAS